MNTSANRTATPAGFHRNARLVCLGIGGWLRSESAAGFVGIRTTIGASGKPEAVQHIAAEAPREALEALVTRATLRSPVANTLHDGTQFNVVLAAAEGS